MRKIYSLVLMTAMLFIGATAWADDVHVTGNTGEALQAVINTAPTNSRIVLDDNIAITPGKPIWVGTLHAYVNEGGNESATGTEVGKKSLTLDLNGHDITCTANANSQYLFMFMLSHGELIVTNSVSGTGGRIIMQAGSKSIHENSAIFSVFGSYKASNVNTEVAKSLTDGLFSHLVIDEGVKLIGRDGAGITVDVARFEGSRSWYQLYHAPNKDNLYGVTFPATDNYGYLTSVSNDGNYYGFAFGVRVDLKGDISMGGVDSEEATTKAYCFKTNGILRDPMHDQTLKPASGHYAFLTGCPNPTENDRQNVPFIYIHSSATLKAPGNSTGAAAIYSSGYAKYVISGYCEGATGVYVKSGDIELNDATITSNYTDGETTITGGTSGIKSGGNGIVIESNDNYSGAQSVTVNGDTKVTTKATGGAAIVDVVDETNNSKIENITINGGTLTGDNAIVISSETAAKADEGTADVAVAGVSVIGTVTVGDLSGSDALGEIMSSNSHTTIVDNTVIISAGGEPDTKDDWSEVGDGEEVNVNWTGTAAITIGDGLNATTRTLGELQLISGTLGNEQVLTVNNKATLIVERLILNSYARITVQAGGKLIVKGDQGINAPVVENITLKTSETAQAIFLFHPNVTSNRHPNATVELISDSYRNSATDRHSHRFGIPMYNDGTATYNGVKSISASPASPTGFSSFDYVNDTWVTIGYLNVDGAPDVDLSQMNMPFEYYQLLCNVAKGTKTTFTFTGALVGNNNPSKTIPADVWYGISNSFMGNMDLAAIINGLGGNISKSIWVYDVNGPKAYAWRPANLTTAAFGETPTIKPMQAMLVRNMSTEESAVATINYKTTVWDPATSGSSAPARTISTASWTTAMMVVSDENGYGDQVQLVQSNDFTTAYDNGYDAEKYFNGDINFYISDSRAMSILATDDLADTYLGFSCVNGGIYTIDFSHIQGNLFDLIDLEANQTIHMTEGASYQFAAYDNEQNDYRFRIVPRQEMPTDIETVENGMIKTDGVYTITGQYLGDLNIWNTLPAGLYIVNGEKKVK